MTPVVDTLAPPPARSKGRDSSPSRPPQRAHNNTPLETFFEKFDLVANAPKAVARMRELVLEWAMHGRLVPQHPEDETAQALLERVTSTAKTGPRGSNEPDSNDGPFQVPASWAWVKLPCVLIEARLIV